MANDRMYIRCKGCGDLHYLAKCYDDGYFTTHEGEELRQGLDDFFDRHKWCYRDKYYGGFELVYESDEDAEDESDDERIRKELKEAFEAYDIESKWNGIPIRSIFAWLEKQKEQKNTSASTMAPSCWEVEQKEQKPVEPSDDELQRHQDELYDFKVFATKQAKEHHISFVHDFEWNNFCAELLSYFNEQKPGSISRGHENDKPAECIEDSVKFEEGFKAGRESGLRDGQKYVLNNLDSYGLCKPAEWSEEDENNLHRVIRVLEDNDSDWKELSDWLKSLRPYWKPSEEQMAALEAATVRYQSTGLESLYEDLKKL